MKTATIVSGKISVEHPRKIARRNAHAFILDLKHRLPPARIAAEMEIRPFLHGIFDGVRDELGQYKG
ncbi:hypothetical protein D3C76_1573360 [compost metagenome]